MDNRLYHALYHFKIFWDLYLPYKTIGLRRKFEDLRRRLMIQGCNRFQRPP